MRTIILFFLMLSCNAVVFSQNQTDSLLIVMKNQNNYVQKITTLNKICTEYQKNDIAKVAFYNQKILELSRKNKYELGYGLYFLQNSTIHLYGEKFKQSLTDALKAKAIFKKNKDTSNYLMAIIAATNSYIQLSETEKAKTILRKNLTTAIKNKNNEIIIDFYRLIGDNCRYQDSIVQSLFYYKKAIPYLPSKKTKAKSIFLEKLSDEYAVLKQYKNALIYIDESIENRETKYRFLGESKKAIYHNYLGDYKKGLAISLKNYDSIVKNKMTSNWHYNLILYNIAYSYFYLGKYNLAISYINKVIDTKNSIPEYKIETLTLLSSINFNMNKKIKAREWINKALIIHDSLYPLGESDYLYPTLTKTEEALGNYKRALYYYKKQTYFDIYNITKRNNEMVFQNQTDFNVALKDANIKQLKIIQLQKTIENKKQKENLVYLFIAFILALLSTFFYVRNNKIIKKKNFIIENEKRLTQKSLAEKEILLKEIHHRVKNNMQLVISLLKIQSLDAKQLSIKEFINVSEARITSMALIHENLYKSDTLDKVYFKDYLNNLTESIIGSQHITKGIELQTEIDETFLDIQTAIPIGLIVNELVNNAYKHAFVNKINGKIDISLKESEGEFTLSISDDGIGFNDKQKTQDGLGLELVRLLVSQIKGVLQIDNTVGTSYTIQFQNAML